MHRSLSWRFVLFGVAPLSLAIAGPSFAEDGWPGGKRPAATETTAAELAAQEEAAAAPAWASVNNILQIPAAGFFTRCGDTNWNYFTPGYISPDSVPCGNTFVFWAPIHLPTGAEITYIDQYVYDNDGSCAIRSRIHSYSGFDTVDTPTFAQIGVDAISSDTTPGYQYNISGLGFSHTVNNDVRYGGGDALAAIVVWDNTSTCLNSNLRIKGVDIWWHRQVSPAPATATFNDVPTSHGFFQYVEALVDAGITGGCGGGNYCPNNPVTRGQMAVFLSVALGLNWPN